MVNNFLYSLSSRIRKDQSKFRLKKFVCCCLVVLLLNCTSCKDNKTVQGSTLHVDAAHSYLSSPVTIIEGDPWEQIGTGLSNGTILDVSKGQAFFQFGEHLYIYDMQKNESIELDLPYLEQHPSDDEHYVEYVFVPLHNGGFSIVYGTFEIETRNVNSMYLEMYNVNHQLVEERELSEKYFPLNNLYHTYAVDSEGIWYMQRLDENGKPQLLLFSDEMEPIEEIRLDDIISISDIFTGSDGHVYLDYCALDKNRSIGRVDTLQHTIIDVPVEMTFVNYYHRGAGEYLFTTYDNSGFYGIKSDGSVDRIVDWFTSDIRPEMFVANDPIMSENGNIFLTEGSEVVRGTYVTNVNRHWMLQPRTDEELKNQQFITLAVVFDQAEVLSEYVRDYNRRSKDVHILLYNYDGVIDNSNKTGLELMYQDMINGTVADIICTNGLPMENFQSKGLFKDLSNIYQQESRISDQNYFTNFIDALYMDDKLLEFSFSYSISTLAAKKKFVSNTVNMDFSDFFDVIDSTEIVPFPSQRCTCADAFYMLSEHSISSWVDSNHYQCNFESDEFIELLEKCKSLYSMDPQYAYKNENDYIQLMEMLANSYKEDRAVFDVVEFHDPYEWHSVSSIDFENTEITYTGWPSSTGKAGTCFVPEIKLAINAESKYVEQAWDFFMFLLSDDVQKRLINTLPVNRQAMKMRMQTAMNLPKDPTASDAPPTYRVGDKQFPLTNATKQEMTNFEAFVEGIDAVLYQNTIINNIIHEESEQYFSGDITAAETAHRIQSRVDLYLSETG